MAWDDHKGIWTWGYDRNVVKLEQNHQYLQYQHPILTLVSDTHPNPNHCGRHKIQGKSATVARRSRDGACEKYADFSILTH